MWHFFLILIWLHLSPLMLAKEFDNTGKTVTFYPSSLMIAHNLRPLIFYSDTHVLNLNLNLKTTPFGKKPVVKIECFPAQKSFMNKVLASVRHTHTNIRRMLSMPGFTNLLECDTFLRNSFVFETKHSSTMVCPRTYRPSLRSCKQWAINKCKNISPEEKTWLRKLARARRSSFACHAGLSGLIRKIYTSFGGSCSSDKLVGLIMKRTLIDLTNALNDEKALVTVVNGKTVQLVKITDKLTSRVNTLSHQISDIDSTLSSWKKEINKFGKAEKCHYDSLLDFTAKYTFESSKMYN